MDLLKFAEVHLHLPWVLWTLSLTSKATSYPIATSLPHRGGLSVTILYLIQGQTIQHTWGMHSLPWES